MKLRLLVGIVGMIMLANIADAAPFAYVLNRGSSHPTAPAPGSVSVIDLGSTPRVVGSPVVLGGRPYSIAVSATGGRIFVANQGGSAVNDQTLKILDADLLTVGSVPIGYSPGGMVLNKAETRLYVADQTNSRVYVYSVSGNTLADVGYLNLNDPNPTKPEGIAIDEAAGRLYVANNLANSTGDRIAAFDLALVDLDAVNKDGSSKLADVLTPLCSSPTGITIASGAGIAKSTVYVSCAMSNNVATFDSAAPAAVTMISVGSAPYGINANSDGSKVYVANAGENISRVTIIATDGSSKTTVNANTLKNNYACSAAEAADKSRYYITNVPINEGSAQATDVHDISVVPVGGTTATSLDVGVNPCSLGNFMGPTLPHTLTLQVTAGTGTITPNRTLDGATNTILAATGAYKTFTLAPSGTSNSVLSVSDGVKTYGSTEKFTVGPITGNMTIQVAFSTVIKYDLIANVNGNGGSCTVTSSPEGINVGASEKTGTGNFDQNSTVIVTAKAVAGSSFKGWSGCDLVSGDVCTVNLNATPKTITATCDVSPLCSDFLRDNSFDSLLDAANAGGNSLIKVTINPTKSITPVVIGGTQSVKIDGGYDLCGNGAKQPGVHSVLPIGSLTISTTGTVELSDITIK